MDGLQEYSSSGDEQQEWPLTPELIGMINGVEPSALKSEHLRKIRRILRGMLDGCVVLVVDGGMIENIYQVEQYIIGPAEK